jgi:hypothetical protein
MQCRGVIPYRRFGTTYLSNFQGSKYLDVFILEDRIDTLSRNVCTELPLYAAYCLIKAQISVFIFSSNAINQYNFLLFLVARLMAKTVLHLKNPTKRKYDVKDTHLEKKRLQVTLDFMNLTF